MELPRLNEEQKAAVEHIDGPLLVVAGAGTGKTQVITRRIAHLIESGAAEPEEILALTFTDKAAGEMLDRLDVLVGWQAFRVNVMTFHAFGGQLIQRFGHHNGISTRTELISEIAKTLLLKQHLNQVKLSYYGHQDDIIDFLQTAVSYIGELQNANVSLDDFARYVDGLKEGHPLDIAETQDRLALYGLYEKLKRQHGLIDYHDQLALALELVQQRPNVAEQLRKQYKYVLVDEYQDTNTVQDELLRELVKPGGNIFAVGDDDQAIYGFRGAHLGNILDFAEHFGVKQPVVLTHNYRSTQQILDSAYQLIQHNNPERLEAKLGLNKRLVSDLTGAKPSFVGFTTAEQEADGVANLVAQKLADGVVPADMAVLAATHGSLRTISRALRKRAVPHHLTSTVNLFEQRELLQLWHLLRWIGLAAPDEAMTHILMGPFFGWSSQRVRGVVEAAKQQGSTIEAALDADDTATDVVAALAEWRHWAQEVPVSQLVYRLIFETDISKQWIAAAEESPRMVRVFEDLQLWLRHLQQFEYAALDPSLAGYIEVFPKPPQITTEEVTGDEHGVALLTVHAAKGLEFDTVIIAGNTNDAWGQKAGSRGVELPPELVGESPQAPEHERRRLLYVAITRAKRQLLITAPLRMAGGRNRKPSPFLAELFEPEAIALPDSGSDQADLDTAIAKLHSFAPHSGLAPSDRLPFEDADGWLELSVTDIDKYERCAYEFYLERVLKIRTPVGTPIQFGNLLHGLFHDYYRSRKDGDPLSLEQLTEHLNQRWSDTGYRSPEEASVDRQRAVATLNSFYQREEQADDRQLLSTEEGFRLVIPEAKLRLRGKIDASFKTADGIEVRDFKTGRKHDADKLATDAKNSLQLRTYALAIQDMTGQAPKRVVLDYIVTGTEGSVELSATILKNHRAKLAKIADSIRARHFPPNSDPKHDCAASRYWGSAEDDDVA